MMSVSGGIRDMLRSRGCRGQMAKSGDIDGTVGNSIHHKSSGTQGFHAMFIHW